MPEFQPCPSGGLFKTADGYLVKVNDLEVAWAWNGVLEGSRESVAEFFTSQLSAKISRMYGSHVPVHLDDEVMNPLYWEDKEWILYLKLDGASIHENGDGAHLATCLLLWSFPEDLGAVLRDAIQQLTWEELASDYEI